jgi:hypothetical protein
MTLGLLQAFKAETNVDTPGSDPTLFEPVSQSMRQILKIKDPAARKGWIKSCEKEIKQLINAKTFSIEEKTKEDYCVPTMEICRIKLRSDGTLDKLKTRIVVRGDL